MFKNWFIGLFVFCCVAFNFVGCHRGYYRRQADKEAQHLIREKHNDPRWAGMDPTIEIDQASRMFDQFSKDHPPIPTDDPASHALMENVDCKPGYPHWHANGDVAYTENPDWMSFLPVNEQGVVELDMTRAVQMGLMHSTDYQQQRETLYLSALDVSAERFVFDSQLSSTWNSFFETRGRFQTGESQSLWQVGAPGTGMTLSKLGTTGSSLVVGLANSLIWNFAGPNTQSATTLIDFSLVQPLLRGAGRDRIMESLTQAERTLLANVRQIERYRRGFYLQITVGRNAGAGPNRGGNFLGAPGTANTNAGGVLGLLQNQQNIRIQESNVASLRNVLEQFRAFSEADSIDPLQVRQAETQLYSAQSNLASQRANYEASLDSFKRTLGLPPSLPIEINDPTLDQFKLIDDEIITKQNAVGEIQSQIGDLLTAAESLIDETTVIKDETTGDITAFAYNSDFGNKLAELRPLLEQSKSIRELLISETFAAISADLDKHEAGKAKRLEQLQSLRSTVEQRYQETGRLDIELSILSEKAIEKTDTLRESLQTTKTNLEGLVAQFGTINAALERLLNEGAGLDPKDVQTAWATINDQLPNYMSKIGTYALEMSLTQALARTDSITLNFVDITDAQAYEIARGFRRDWMNARASLVDQYRQIEFAADDLESQLDLVFEGDIGNTGDNPFRLRYETGSLRAGFRFDAPLTRLLERNRYREVLINYQQSKRAYYEYQDEISRNLRQIVRQIELNKILFELNRRAVKTSVQQVELSQLALQNPAQTQLGPVASRNLTDALTQLQRSQNSFLESWVSFEVLRRNLDFDLGTMQLTQDGFWLDPGEISSEIAYKAAAAYGLDAALILNPQNHLNKRPGLEDDSVGLLQQINQTNEQNVPMQNPGIDMQNPVMPNGGNENSNSSGYYPGLNGPRNGLYIKQPENSGPIRPPLGSQNSVGTKTRTGSRFFTNVFK